MNKDLVTVFELWETNRGISRSELVPAIEDALQKVAAELLGPYPNLRVRIDPNTGDIAALTSLRAVERVRDEYHEIALSDASRVKANARLGELILVNVAPASFGRTMSRHAKETLQMVLKENRASG
jgi:N utilization substance protein A